MGQGQEAGVTPHLSKAAATCMAAGTKESGQRVLSWSTSLCPEGVGGPCFCVDPSWSRVADMGILGVTAEPRGPAPSQGPLCLLGSPPTPTQCGSPPTRSTVLSRLASARRVRMGALL